MRIAALDIGSNTVKISVFEKSGTKLTEICRKSIPAGLISTIENGILPSYGYRILKDTLTTLQGFAKEHGCTEIFPFATASMRAASNREEIFRQILKDTGMSICLLDGQIEADLTFAGLIHTRPDITDGLLLDMGGGSTEWISFVSQQIQRRDSFSFGALTLHNRFVHNILPTKEEAVQISDFVQAQCRKSEISIPTGGQLYLNGGSGKCLAKLFAASEGADARTKEASHAVLYQDELRALSDDLIACKPSAKLLLMRILPERAHTIPTALLALLTVMETVGVHRVAITDASVREGYLLRITQTLPSPDERNG